MHAARIVFPPEDRAEIAAAVTESLTTGALTLGPYTRQFEADFAAAHRIADAIAVTSGTAALEIILRAIGVTRKGCHRPGEHVLRHRRVAVIAAGGSPVFADIDAATFALSPPRRSPAALTPNTAAVVLVHIGGLIIARRPTAAPGPVPASAVSPSSRTPRTRTAASSTAFGRLFGVAGAFSFYPTKVITSGEGGMIVTASSGLRDEARVYRDQGKGGFDANLPHPARLRLAD